MSRLPSISRLSGRKVVQKSRSFEKETSQFRESKNYCHHNIRRLDYNVYCRVLPCVAVCCIVLQCVVVCCSVLQRVTVCCRLLHFVAVCCSAQREESVK